MFDYIFLDLDGPVLEGRERHYACYRDIIVSHGGQPLDIDTYWSLKRQKTTRDAILLQSGFHAAYDVFMTEWMNRIETPLYLAFDRPKPDIHNQLRRLKTHARHTYLVTMRHNRDALLRQLDDLDLTSSFDMIVDCPPMDKDTKYNKLKHLNFKRALVIGDTEEDVKTAALLRVPCIGISNGLREPRHLDTQHIFPELCNIPDDLFVRLGA